MSFVGFVVDLGQFTAFSEDKDGGSVEAAWRATLEARGSEVVRWRSFV